MHPYEAVLATAAFIITTLILYKTVKRWFWNRPAPQHDVGVSSNAAPFALGDASSEATPSTLPSNDGAPSVVRLMTGPALTPREVRATAIRERCELGLCLYCDRHACRALPEVRLIKPLLDPLWRRLNVVPVNKWKIVTDVGVDAPYKVCDAHSATARSHLEQRMAENSVSYAKFVVQQRDEMFEFVEFALDEIMLQDSDRIRRKRPEKPAAQRAGGM